jgi:Tfp pilus assembly protein PilF
MQNIQKFMLTLILLSGVFTVITAQTAREFIKKGVELYDNGKFKEAIEQYEMALKIDPKNPTTLYEMSSTYISLEKYDDALKCAEKIVKLKNGNEELAYVTMGTAYDMMGKPKKAVKAYEEGIKAFPKEYNLYYNLGITQYNLKEYEKAEKAAISSSENNPNHANSHVLLGNIAMQKGKKIKSMLPIYGYLRLVPTGKRSVKLRETLEELYLKGVSVKKNDTEGLTINLTMSDDNEEFGSEESTLSLMASLMSISLNQTLKDSLKMVVTPESTFFSNTESLFELLCKNERKPYDSFWQRAYVNPFKELLDSKHLEAFCYSVYGNTEGVKKWQEANVDKVAAYGNWLKDKKEKADKVKD